MNDNHRILGMERNIAYGVCFIFPILAIVVLIADRSLNTENKQFMCEAILGLVAGIVLGLATFFLKHALGWVVWAIMIFIGVINLTGNITHLPFISSLVERYVR